MSLSKKGSTPPKEMIYREYLQLDKILGAQTCVSGQDGNPPHHDEHFFIIMHQVYELWFKTINFELGSVMASIGAVDFSKLNRVNEKMTRIINILKLMTDQILLMDTLNPAEFMEFRGYLFPASGFQSFQFRILENTFGLKPESRSEFGRKHYRQSHPPEIIEQIEKSEKEASFLEVVDKWLALVFEKEPTAAAFWAKYKKGVEDKIEDTKTKLDDDAKNKEGGDVSDQKAKAEAVWLSVIDGDIHKSKGGRKLSFEAWQGALMVTYMRNKSEKYAQAYRFINFIRDADNLLMRWRYNHILMVHRQIGDKAGTGGTKTGVGYLKETIGDQYRVFRDLFDLNGFLLDPKYLPEYYGQ